MQRCANMLINNIAVKTMNRISRTFDRYDRKFDANIALLDKYNIRGLYDFTRESAELMEDINEETTRETKKLMNILTISKELKSIIPN